MKVQVIRTAMCGGGLSYDVEVPLSEVDARDASYRICRDGQEFVPYPSATCPTEQRAMDKGWPRYSAWLKHEKAARRQMLTIARHAFPELRGLNTDTLPQLWTTGLMDAETDAIVDLDVRFDCCGCGGLIINNRCRNCDTAINARDAI